MTYEEELKRLRVVEYKERKRILWEGVPCCFLDDLIPEGKRGLFREAVENEMNNAAMGAFVGFGPAKAFKVKQILYAFFKDHIPDGYKIIPLEGFPGYAMNRNGVMINMKDRRVVRRSYDKDQERFVYRLSHNMDRTTQLVGKLLIMTFVPNVDPNKNEVNHINGNKIDDRLENLEWVSRKGNIEHAFNTGLMDSVLSCEQVREILYSAEGNEVLAKEYNTTIGVIGGVRRGRLYLRCGHHTEELLQAYKKRAAKNSAGVGATRRKLTKEDVKWVLENPDVRSSDVGRKYGVDQAIGNQIRRGKKYCDWLVELGYGDRCEKKEG